MDDFFHLPALPATANPGRTRRNCHLPGKSLAEQLPPTLDISQADALKHIAGYSEFPSLSLGYPLLRSAALAVDMTARNIQEVAKSKGLPWSAAHGMDTFTPIG